MTHSPLTPREHEIVRDLVEGFTPQEIAARLEITPGTVGKYLQRMRKRLGARNNEQMVLLLAWHHAQYLTGAMVKHGTKQALDWHSFEGVPLCVPCGKFQELSEVKYRRLTPVPDHAKQGQPVECGTIQAARRHMAANDRLGDLTCGCREAYQEWHREYGQQRRALGIA